MHTVPSEARGMLAEILAERASGTAAADDAGIKGTSWFLSRIEVRGHVGIGESPVCLDLPPQPGLTVVTARNGTDKTSIAHGMQLALGGSVTNPGVLDRNLHHDERRIRVALTGDGRQVTLSRAENEPVRWMEGGEERGVPQAWHAAFQRYQPVLLYPAVARTIENPGELHGLLASALDLHVLEQLQKLVDDARKTCRDARKSVEQARWTVDQLLEDERYGDLRQAIHAAGSNPTAAGRDSIRAKVRTLSPTNARALPTLPLVAVPASGANALAEYVRRYVEKRGQLIDGTEGFRDALDLLADSGNQLLTHQRDNDICPLCGAEGRRWLSTAQQEATRLRDLLSEHDAAKRSLDRALGELSNAVPLVPQPGLTSLRDHPELGEEAAGLGAEWETVRTALTRLQRDQITERDALETHGRVDELRTRRNLLDQRIGQAREASHDEHASLKSAVEEWLSRAESNEHDVARERPANRLSDWVSDRIKETRGTLFQPIAQRATHIWSRLDPDGNLGIRDVALAGGTRQARKVRLRLQLGDTAVPEGDDGIQVLSTGQRNALSLATYLPRATQEGTPFRFLVLDDPVQAFDEGRVRYLAQQLTELARSFQIVVFTHDDRLWREIRAHGPHAWRMHLERPPDGRSLVRVAEATSPGQLLLDDLRETLGEYDTQAGSAGVTEEAISAFTLAVCRQALDAEITQQVETLGRRCGKSGDAIRSALDQARDTRQILALLDRHCREADLPVPDRAAYEPTLGALNQGAHGQAPTGVTLEQRWTWHRHTRELVARLAALGHPSTGPSP